MIDPAKITAIIIFESKTYVSRSKHRNRKRSGKCYALIKKDISNKKHIDQMDLQNISENQKVQRTAKFIVAGFYEMDFMKGIVRLAKVDDMQKVLKSPLANRFWSRDGTG